MSFFIIESPCKDMKFEAFSNPPSAIFANSCFVCQYFRIFNYRFKPDSSDLFYSAKIQLFFRNNQIFR